MTEHQVKHKYVIDKYKRSGRVNLLTVRKRIDAFNPIFSIRISPSVPDILFNTPEWLKDFVHRMNVGEIKIRIKIKNDKLRN